MSAEGGEPRWSPMAKLVRQVCSEGDPQLSTTLPAGAYSSQEYFDLETRAILRAGWQCAGREEQVAAPGSYQSVDVLGVPLVLTSDSDADMHVMSRTCRHRWMEVASGAGTAATLQCGYHKWCYALNGQLLQAPLMDGVREFPTQDIRLPAVRHELWNGFVFVNLDGEAPPLAAQLTGLSTHLDDYDLDQYRTVYSESWECDWDWKVMVENFVECYHHIGTHADTLGRDFPAREARTLSSGTAYSAVSADRAKGSPRGLAIPGSKRLSPEQAARMLIVAIFPLSVFALSPGSMVWLRINPRAPGITDLELNVDMSAAALADDERSRMQSELVADVLAVNAQDMAVCSSVQRGIWAEKATSVGRLGPSERPIWDFYQYIGAQLDRVQAQEELSK